MCYLQEINNLKKSFVVKIIDLRMTRNLSIYIYTYIYRSASIVHSIASVIPFSYFFWETTRFILMESSWKKT